MSMRAYIVTGTCGPPIGVDCFLNTCTIQSKRVQKNIDRRTSPWIIVITKGNKSNNNKKNNNNSHIHEGELRQKNFEFEIDEFVAGYPNLLTRNEEHPPERKRRLNQPIITRSISNERNLGVCDRDDKLDAKCYINKYPEEYKKSKPIARLLIDGSGVCTGFLVGNKGHLLTTNKCVHSDKQAKQVDVQFMYESSACQGFNVPLVRTYDVEKLVTHSAQNDYSLLLLKGVPHSTVG